MQMPARSGSAMVPKDSAEIERRVLEGLPMVRKLAAQVALSKGYGSDLDDVIACGQAALFEAARRFDATRGVPFLNYAAIRVKGAMLDGGRKLRELPTGRLRAFKSAAQRQASPHNPNGLEALTERALVRRGVGVATARVTGMLPELGVDTQGEFMAVASDPSPEQGAQRRELRDLVVRGLDELPPRQATLIRRTTIDDEPVEQVAAELGMSKWAASRMRQDGFRQLREQAEQRSRLEGTDRGNK